MLVRYLICPSPLMPISSTRTEASEGADKMVFARPISLLRFAGVFQTLNEVALTSEINSFTEVLPTDPVMPITLQSSLNL